MRTSKRDAMTDAEIEATIDSDAFKEHSVAIVEAQAAGEDLTPGERRFQKILDDAADNYLASGIN